MLEMKDAARINSATVLAVIFLLGFAECAQMSSNGTEFEDPWATAKFACILAASVAVIGASIASPVISAKVEKRQRVDDGKVVRVAKKKPVLLEFCLYNLPSFLLTAIPASIAETRFKKYSSERGVESIALSDLASFFALISFLFPVVSQAFSSLDNLFQGVAISVLNSGGEGSVAWQEYFYGSAAGLINGWVGGLLYEFIYHKWMQPRIERLHAGMPEFQETGAARYLMEQAPAMGVLEEGRGHAPVPEETWGQMFCYFATIAGAFAGRAMTMELARTFAQDVYEGDFGHDNVGFFTRLGVNLLVSVACTALYAPAIHNLKKWQYAQVNTPCDATFWKKTAVNLLQGFSGNVVFQLVLPALEGWLQGVFGVNVGHGVAHSTPKP